MDDSVMYLSPDEAKGVPFLPKLPPDMMWLRLSIPVPARPAGLYEAHEIDQIREAAADAAAAMLRSEP